jgi:beta-lactamase regulating signal transducer with metallopeptidase domain
VSAWSNWMDSISGISIIVLIYGVGCVFALIRLLYRLVLIKRNFKTFYPGQAYSFFNKVHIDPGLIGYTTIVEHENIHVRQFHSLDIILVELVKIINWFNPIVYLFHRSMK